MVVSYHRNEKGMSFAAEVLMRIRDVQRDIHQWIGNFEEGYFPPLANLARLMEEVGELARALNQRFGGKKPKASDAAANIEEEMGDILFTVAVLANSLDIDLERVMQRTMSKVVHRDSSRWTMKEGVSLSEILATTPRDDSDA